MCRKKREHQKIICEQKNKVEDAGSIENTQKRQPNLSAPMGTEEATHVDTMRHGYTTLASQRG